MRFLVDECTGPAVARWLRQQDHDVFSVHDQARGMEDDRIIQKAFNENWIIITNDKDFGEKVYRERYPHRGIVLLRLDDERTGSKIDALRSLLRDYAERSGGRFVSDRSITLSAQQVSWRSAQFAAGGRFAGACSSLLLRWSGRRETIEHSLSTLVRQAS